MVGSHMSEGEEYPGIPLVFRIVGEQARQNIHCPVALPQFDQLRGPIVLAIVLVLVIIHDVRIVVHSSRRCFIHLRNSAYSPEGSEYSMTLRAPVESGERTVLFVVVIGVIANALAALGLHGQVS